MITAQSAAGFIAHFLDGSWRAECPPLELTVDDVARTAPLLIGSGAAALGWRRIKDTPALRDCAAAELLRQSGRILALEDTRHDGQVEFVARRLNEVGIDPLIVKGWAVAHFYAARDLRAYGDFDLCAPPGFYKLAHETLSRLRPPRFPEVNNGDIYVDCGPNLGVCTVDLHENFPPAYMPPIDTLFARSTPATAGAASIRLLAHEDHLRFVVMHFLKHGGWRPTGLCDVAAMVEAIPPDFDWALCLSGDKIVATWIGATIMLAHRLLGCRLDRVPQAVRIDPPCWFERAVLREWEAPYAGRFRSVAARSLAKYPGDFSHWLSARWPTPVAALVNTHLPVDSPYRLPHQIASFASALARGLIRYLREGLSIGILKRLQS